MPPNSAANIIHNEAAAALPEEAAEKKEDYSCQEIQWTNVFIISMAHVFALWGLSLMFTTASAATNIWCIFLMLYTGGGLTAGAHRYYAHRAFKAKWPLEWLLMTAFTMAGQNTILEWVRDHRTHHKYSDTDADPHNAKRGFFFSHIGWLLMTKHPEVKRKGKTIDMSDLKANPFVMFQYKYFVPYGALWWLLIPIFTPYYMWDEELITSIMVPGFFRYISILNVSFLVNSAAHLWGNKPYDKDIKPTENPYVSVFSGGEGWHNYHHAFPFDYKAAELGNYRLNFTTAAIDFFAWIGWAYDLKTVSPDMVKRKMLRSGDGTHQEVSKEKDT